MEHKSFLHYEDRLDGASDGDAAEGVPGLALYHELEYRPNRRLSALKVVIS